MCKTISVTNKTAVGIKRDCLINAFCSIASEALRNDDITSFIYWNAILHECAAFSDDMVMICEFDSKDLE